MEAQMIDSVRAQIRSSIDSSSKFDASYVIMNGLATVVACYGLFENSPAVVIGAMITEKQKRMPQTVTSRCIRS